MDCCKINNKNKDKGILKGILYGLVPHTFCILFVVFSIIGAVSLTAVFKKFLLIPYFFHFLIFLSFIMATISAIVYLKRNDCLCGQGIKRKWKYLTILYGITIFVNMFMFSYVFPVLANINSKNLVFEDTTNLSITVQIPCSGHAPLIIDELKKDPGIKNIVFSMPNKFKIDYDPKQTNPQKISSMEIFKTYTCTIDI